MKKGMFYVITGFLVVLTIQLSAQTDKKVMPQLGSNQLWVSSVPTGLDVYIAPLDRLKIVPENIKGNWVKLYDRENHKFYIDNKKYYKGKTPLLLSDVGEGEYLIAYGPIDFWGGKYSDPTLFKVAEVSSVPITPENASKLNKGTIKEEGLDVFYFKKEPNKGKAIILTNIKDFTLDGMTAKYPKGINYHFNREQLRADLLKKNILNTGLFSDSDINNAFELLERGGKVTYLAKNNNIRLIIEITGNDQWKITTQRSTK